MSLAQGKKNLNEVMRPCYLEVSGGSVVAKLCFFEFDTTLKLNHNYAHDFLSSLVFLKVVSMMTFSPNPTELWQRKRGHILIFAYRLQMISYFSAQFTFLVPETNFEYVHSIFVQWQTTI